MEQLLLHLFGDYVLQTDKQALNKKRSSIQCFLHCLTYSLPFLLITNWIAVLIIGTTHFIIDRWNLIPCIIAIKNRTFKRISVTRNGKLKMVTRLYTANYGFHESRPFAVSIWLMIIFDNTIHLIINYIAITTLR